MRAQSVSMYLMFGAFALAVSSSYAEIPEEAKDPGGKHVRNAFTGDSRIEVRSFHPLLVQDPGFAGSSTFNDLNAVFESFNKDIAKRANSLGLQASSEQFAFDPIPQISDVITSKEDLDRAIEQLRRPGRVKPGDVVFFWAEAHGTKKATKTYLELAGELIDRDELRGKLEFPDRNGRRQTHLLVFITDNCSTISTDGVSAAARKAVPGREPHRPGGIWRSLYFGHSGTVDIASSSKNQSSFSLNGRSLFALAFAETFDELIIDKSKLDKKPPDELVAWEEEYFPALESRTKMAFKNFLDTYFDAAENPTAELMRLPADQQLIIKNLKTTGLEPDWNSNVQVNPPRPRR